MEMNNDILFAGLATYAITITAIWAYHQHRLAVKEMLRTEERESNRYLLYKEVELLRQERTGEKLRMQSYKLH
ncbi:MAG: hypothetical protein ACP5FR_00805 [Candidatus Micrarchaeia archaeon]